MTELKPCPMNGKQDYRRLVKDLRGCANYGGCGECAYNDDGICVDSMLSAAADAIETLLNGIEAYRQAVNSEWVSVENEFPKDWKKVVALGEHRGITEIGIAIYLGDKWFSNGMNCKQSEITHWMPLPELPEAEHE